MKPLIASMKPGKTIKHMTRDKICDSPVHDLSLSETPGMEWAHINITRADRSGQSVTRTTHFLPQIENLKRLPDHEDHITVLSCYLWDVSTKILLNQRRVNIGQILLTLKVRCALCRHAVSTESWFSFIRRQVKRKRLDLSTRYKLDSQ